MFFKYNYDLLTRWLLKVCYNSARANDSYYDIGLYQKNIDYILKGKEAGSKIEVYALFMETAYDKQKQNVPLFINVILLLFHYPSYLPYFIVALFQ